MHNFLTDCFSSVCTDPKHFRMAGSREKELEGAGIEPTSSRLCNFMLTVMPPV